MKIGRNGRKKTIDNKENKSIEYQCKREKKYKEYQDTICDKKVIVCDYEQTNEVEPEEKEEESQSRQNGRDALLCLTSVRMNK